MKIIMSIMFLLTSFSSVAFVNDKTKEVENLKSELRAFVSGKRTNKQMERDLNMSCIELKKNGISSRVHIVRCENKEVVCYLTSSAYESGMSCKFKKD